MKTVLAVSIILALCLAPQVHAQVIDVRMGFVVTELHAKHGQPHYDTCGIRTGALDGSDTYDREYPALPPPDGTFDAHWFFDNETWFRTDMRPPPPHLAPPFEVDYLMDFMFGYALDTMSIAWSGLHPSIDSIRIVDTLLDQAGQFVSRAITKNTPGADVLLWTQPAGIDLTRLIFRVYYNQSVTGVAQPPAGAVPSASLMISPNPAHDVARVVALHDGVIVVRDLVGREVARVAARADESLDVPLAGVPRGAYLVELMNGSAPAHSLLIVR